MYDMDYDYPFNHDLWSHLPVGNAAGREVIAEGLSYGV